MFLVFRTLQLKRGQTWRGLSGSWTWGARLLHL